MNNKQDSNKILLISSVAFIAVAIILFVVQNFALGNDKVATMPVFVANREIKAYDALTADLFTMTSIPVEGNKVIADNYITKVEDFANMYASNTIKKGEILSKSRLTADNDEKGLDYSILLDAPYVGDVAYGDNVRVYVMDSVTGSTNVLFKRKKIYKSKVAGTEEVSQEDIATAEATGTTYEAATAMYIKVSASELQEYYTLKKSKEFIVVPILTDEGTASTDSSSNKDSQETLASAGLTTTTNHVVTGDNETVDSIAKKYNTTSADIMKLNTELESSTKVLAKGTEVKIPAQNTAE